MDEHVNIDEAIASIRNLISSSYGADKNLTSNLGKKKEALEKASATIGITNETSFSKEKANELEDFLKSMK